MLFNSYEFILVFLPVTLIVFFLLGKNGFTRAALSWLVLASLFFYGYWNPKYLLLIFLSILFNYAVGAMFPRMAGSRKKLLLLLGIGANLGALGYFKYANFFMENLNSLAGLDIGLGEIVLPLAISFFTFQQIAYLVDSYKGEATELNFPRYVLFVTFFPQLIAGPIVHHKEMLPQFSQPRTFLPNRLNLSLGLAIFSIGLFKKVGLADNISVYVGPVFDAVEAGWEISFFEAWGGVLAYTFQLYFDFSGYSDMAIGLARMFGIRLPLNFFSPYKARNIVDFWRRWHITLSRFLRDYLYISLGGNRKGPFRRYVNLFTTMLLGGLWHGAGWTFVVWGGLHGTYLVVNHAWHALSASWRFGRGSWWMATGARVITFLAVILGWVVFRAQSVEGGVEIVGAMAGLNGFALPTDAFSQFGWTLRVHLAEQFGWRFETGLLLGGMTQLAWIAGLWLIAWFGPNTYEIVRKYRPALDKHLAVRPGRSLLLWRPTPSWAIGTTALLLLSILALGEVSEFLYFQF